MNKLFLGSLMIASTVLLASCDKDSDFFEPTLKVTANVATESRIICGELENNVLVMQRNDTLILKSVIKGSNELSQMKISIHDAGDCHGHDRPATEWTYSKIIDLSGKKVERQDTIVIPMDAEFHNHHVDIEVLDVKGLDSEEVEFDMVIVE